MTKIKNLLKLLDETLIITNVNDNLHLSRLLQNKETFAYIRYIHKNV